MKKEYVNKYGVEESKLQIGKLVDSTDGINGQIVRKTKGIFPYLIKFDNGSAWTSFLQIKRIH